VEEVADHDDSRAIPFLIGLIEADNSSETISPAGRGLEQLTGVKYSRFHDGPWWRRWWEANKAELPAEVRGMSIPDFPKTWHGARYQSPYPEGIDSLQGKLRMLADMVAAARRTPAERVTSMYWAQIASEINEHEDPRAIPYLIGVIEQDPTGSAIYGIGYFGLGFGLTEVDYDESHDGRWWRRWWEENKGKLPAGCGGLRFRITGRR
jgi:hypothetical protein